MGRKIGKRSKDNGSTKIENLEVDDVEPEEDELDILESLLDIPHTNPAEYSKLKYVFFATAIFALLSLPFTERIIELATPIANSWLILLIIKTMMFFILYYIVVYAQN